VQRSQRILSGKQLCSNPWQFVFIMFAAEFRLIDGQHESLQQGTSISFQYA
jgi:hypothetical protein